MNTPVKLFEVNPNLDTTALARQFAVNKRIQVRDVLTRETALEMRKVMEELTPWGMAMQAGDSEPKDIRLEELRDPQGNAKAQELNKAAHDAAARGDYAFRYARYPMVLAYQEKWNEGSPHDLLIEHINTEPWLDLVRKITGMDDLIKADGQATLFGRQHFLGLHWDMQVDEGWKIAYVLNLTIDEWKPDWGGYLNFYNEEGDVIEGYMPRFNTLNLFAVPQAHAVTFVPPFAPHGRFAISGWFRDR